MAGDGIASALEAFAEYPLSLTVLGAIVIITAGIIYSTNLTKTFYSILLLLFSYIAVTLINSWWFRAGRFGGIGVNTVKKSVDMDRENTELAKFSQISNMGLALLAAGLVVLGFAYSVWSAGMTAITGVYNIATATNSLSSTITNVTINNIVQHTESVEAGLTLLGAILLLLGVVIWGVALYKTNKVR